MLFIIFIVNYVHLLGNKNNWINIVNIIIDIEYLNDFCVKIQIYKLSYVNSAI